MRRGLRQALSWSLIATIAVSSAACTPVAPTPVAPIPPAPAPSASLAVDTDSANPGRLITRDGRNMCFTRAPLSGGASLHGTGPTRTDFDGDGVDDLAWQTSIGPNYVPRELGVVPIPDRPYTCHDGTQVRYASGRYVDFLLFEGFSAGSSMAPGDFNGDGYDDLAIGDKYELLNGAPDIFAGGVWIVPGGPDGLRPDSVVHVTQDSPGVPGHAESDDGFGETLVAGDLNGDGRDDLAIGTPGESIGDTYEAGAVTVLFGGPSGITTNGAIGLDQSTGAVPGDAASGRRFGEALAIGNVNRDTYADLVISAPSVASRRIHEDNAETCTACVPPGMLFLVWGGPSGLQLTNVTSVTATDVVRPGEARAFGGDVNIEDTDGDGLGDIVAALSTGVLLVFPGRATGLSVAGVRHRS